MSDNSQQFRKECKGCRSKGLQRITSETTMTRKSNMQDHMSAQSRVVVWTLEIDRKETPLRLSWNMHMTNVTHQTPLRNMCDVWTQACPGTPMQQSICKACNNEMWKQKMSTSWHTKCNRDVTIAEWIRILGSHSGNTTRIIDFWFRVQRGSRRSGDLGVYVHSGSGRSPSKKIESKASFRMLWNIMLCFI